jgi:propionyl-CoA synthetase
VGHCAGQLACTALSLVPRRRSQQLLQRARPLVRERIGPVASFKTATTVERLPKTRSGKIVRGTIKKIADGAQYTVPPTIDDPATLDEITADLAALGYPRERPT